MTSKNDKIVAALGKLNVDNDNHWTADGLPKLDALRFNVGESVTREELTVVAPGYTRRTPFFTENRKVESNSYSKAEQLPVVPETSKDKEALETEEASEVSQAVSKLTVTVGVNNLLSGLFDELTTNFTGLDLATLEAIEEQYKTSMQVEQKLLGEVTAFIAARADAYNNLREHISKAQPKTKLNDQLVAFRQTMANADLPVNRPRQVVRQQRGMYIK